MSSSTQYLDRLRNIRDKYGCSQTKTNSTLYSEQYAGLTTSPAKNYPQSDLYALGSKKYGESILIARGEDPIALKTYAPASRPQSSLGITSSAYTSGIDYSKRLEREKQIQQIRNSYAESRRKVIEDFSTRVQPRDYAKQIYKSPYTLDHIKGEREYARDYCIERNPEIRTIDTALYKNPRSSLLEKPYLGEQSISPIKRMADFEEKKSYRGRQFDTTSDAYWKEREARLSQLTANRLNQNKLLFRDEKLLDNKLGASRRSGIYSGENIKTLGDTQRFSAIGLQNKPQYSVSNIDRIQQRIQSILGKR